MKKLFYLLATAISLVSCGSTYNIQGSSNVSTLDGRMLYLKVLDEHDFKNLDSCDVVHGQFHFSGQFDSVRIASIFMDDESVLPLVLESGEISILINNTQQTVSGTPLNDELFRFFNKWNQLRNEQSELVHRHDQAIMDGSDMNRVIAELNAEAMRLSALEDSLVTSFVTENFDNVLGPGVFMMLTQGNIYPQLTPWIEDIMSKATQKFKNDAYVRDYYQKARENEEIMNGMREMPQPAANPVTPPPPPHQLGSPAR